MDLQDFCRYYHALLSRSRHPSPVAADAQRDYAVLLRRLLLII